MMDLRTIDHLTTGIVGFFGSVALAIPAWIGDIEPIMRLVSLTLSMTVAIFTLFKLNQDRKNGRGKRKKTI
jgi:hypothetical protein